MQRPAPEDSIVHSHQTPKPAREIGRRHARLTGESPCVGAPARPAPVANFDAADRRGPLIIPKV